MLNIYHLEQRITANLAPAFLRKVGPGFDSALALALLAASEQIPADAQDPVHVTRWCRSGANAYSVNPCESTRTVPRPGIFRVATEPAQQGDPGGQVRRGWHGCLPGSGRRPRSSHARCGE